MIIQVQIHEECLCQRTGLLLQLLLFSEALKSSQKLTFTFAEKSKYFGSCLYRHASVLVLSLTSMQESQENDSCAHFTTLYVNNQMHISSFVVSTGQLSEKLHSPTRYSHVMENSTFLQYFQHSTVWRNKTVLPYVVSRD